jgi:hypothetical protein
VYASLLLRYGLLTALIVLERYEDATEAPSLISLHIVCLILGTSQDKAALSEIA